MYAQPWGWAAREYLRKLLVGHQVRFKVDYKVATLNNRVRLCFCLGVMYGVLVVEGGGWRSDLWSDLTCHDLRIDRSLAPCG